MATIRGPDGSLLTSPNGTITSHLVGLFSRTTKLMEYGIKVIYVFDGEAPELKKKERERRNALKIEAEESYKQAIEAGDIDAMKKYASRTSKMTPEMVNDAKELLIALGIPVIQAVSEGEAQVAYMAQKGDVDYAASQDFDSLLFGAPKVIRNLSILGKRKKVNKATFETVSPQIVSLSETLNSMGITRDQLIVLAILIGTDFNYGGIKGIGPKTALKLVKTKTDFDEIFFEAKWSEHYDFSWRDVFELFKNMPVNSDYVLEWKPVNAAAVEAVLITKHAFARERVMDTIEKLKKMTNTQKGLGDFF
jgi:flap endonuclease-1